MNAQPSGNRSLDIIYFSSIDWNFTWQRPQQLASRLSRHGKVFYVSPLGLRTVAWRDAGRIARRFAFQIAHRSAAQRVPALTIHTPLFYLPFPENRAAIRLNSKLLRRSVQRWMIESNVENPIIWAGSPSFAILDAIEGMDARLLVYDCLDNFPLFHKNPYPIIDAEQQIASRANIVFATAAELYDRMRLINPHTFLMPNAADYAHFSETADREIPAEMEQMKKPILGYVGEMAQWFDFDLVRALAARHPEWTIVLVGALHVNAGKAFDLPNIRHLGRKEYSQLPAYVRQFDVCLLPFKINALTASVNPVKMYEYLAAGKPVVSTPLREAMRYQDALWISDPADFARAVEQALQTRADPSRIRARQEIARQNTWDGRVTEIVKILSEAIGASA
jgi:glycosyltransferase involved in cell wall biosynthesis